MRDIYHVTIHGRVLESRDLRQLLARAVREKRSMDQKLHAASSARISLLDAWRCGDSPQAEFALGTSR